MKQTLTCIDFTVKFSLSTFQPPELNSPSRRWVDNIRVNLVDMRCGDVDWIGLAQDTDRWRSHVNSVLILRVP
jgi:hypothetical protein